MTFVDGVQNEYESQPASYGTRILLHEICTTSRERLKLRREQERGKVDINLPGPPGTHPA